MKGVVKMLISVSVILLSGFLSGWVCEKVKFPGLFGMIIAGILIGPGALSLIDPSVLNISSDLRRIALIIILIRAGLKLDLSDLKKVGRPAVLMCFVPACFEIIGMTLLAPRILGISTLDAAIMGAVVGAVSPAVIVPRMIALIDGGYGVAKSVPQMILAGASVDDVFVIVLFTTFTGLAQGGEVSVAKFVLIPVSILTGSLTGLALGRLFAAFFQRFHFRDSKKVIALMGITLALVAFEDAFSEKIPFASLIAVMCVGIAIKKSGNILAARLSGKFDRLWVPAEIFLFVLVGASVEIRAMVSAGFSMVVLIFGVLLFRMLGVFACLIHTNLNLREKLFCMIAYTPKATVQAAIGGIPLAMGLSCGMVTLTVSVLAILITAPVGAFAIDLTYKVLLKDNA